MTLVAYCLLRERKTLCLQYSNMDLFFHNNNSQYTHLIRTSSHSLSPGYNLFSARTEHSSSMPISLKSSYFSRAPQSRPAIIVRTVFFSVITLPVVVISYLSFGETYRSRNVGKKLPLLAA